MYDTSFQTQDISKHTFLITGGAGFIGSNIVTYLMKYKAGKVIVLDNLSNGYLSNIKQFFDEPNFEFIEGDITDFDTCKKVMDGVDYISHQAALGSVPRSIENPIATHLANTCCVTSCFFTFMVVCNRVRHYENHALHNVKK